MFKSTPTPDDAFLRGLSFFAGLPEPDMAAFRAAMAVKNYAKGQNLFHQGDKADRLFVILRGWCKLYRGTAEGEEAIVAVFTRGDVFGEAAIFDNADYPVSAEAAEELSLIEIPAKTLKARARENIDITTRLMASMSREMHKLQIENEHKILMDAPQRVGCLLLQLSSDMIGTGGTFLFPYDKSLAAQRLGMKSETFSRALAQLKAAGVTVHGPEITIDSFDRLIDYSCGHCSAVQNECRGSCRATDCKNCAQTVKFPTT
ncbi:MAG: Crp/Fnr family transcriptional regulator [Alphaproteobacteria bacterium]|nr:Crp/Fnr family transcriptional regulator [Alphaproteobacteria bacterium]MDE2335901.1 Crp/Fnr family transcriptional regulator [Alphaproteobacteria bacterium]